MLQVEFPIIPAACFILNSFSRNRNVFPVSRLIYLLKYPSLFPKCFARPVRVTVV